MVTIREKAEALPDHKVVRLDPVTVMTKFSSACGSVLEGKVNKESLLEMCRTQQQIGYLIGETFNPAKKGKLQTKILRLSSRVIGLLKTRQVKDKRLQSLIRDIHANYNFELDLQKRQNAAQKG